MSYTLYSSLLCQGEIIRRRCSLVYCVFYTGGHGQHGSWADIATDDHSARLGLRPYEWWPLAASLPVAAAEHRPGWLERKGCHCPGKGSSWVLKSQGGALGVLDSVLLRVMLGPVEKVGLGFDEGQTWYWWGLDWVVVWGFPNKHETLKAHLKIGLRAN